MKKKYVFKRRFMRWIRAFIEVAESLVAIISFTTITPRWSYDFVFWDSKRNISDSIRERNVEAKRNLAKIIS